MSENEVKEKIEESDVNDEEYRLKQFVPQVHYELLPISALVSSQNYQRNISFGHVQRTAADFNIYQINPVKVSRRDGMNYVFDGQHTIEIVALASGSRETPVWCMIYDDLEYTSEADIFANQMKYKKGLRPFEIFNANIEAGSEKQLLIKELVESYDLQIAPCQQTGCISAISALEYIYDKYHFDGLDHVLLLDIGTWEGANGSLGGSILKGIALLIEAFGDTLDDELFMERIGRMSVKELVRTAKERRGGSYGYAEAMLFEYNKRCKQGRLSLSKLYAAKKSRHKNIYIDEVLAESENQLEETYEDEEEKIQFAFNEAHKDDYESVDDDYEGEDTE